MLEGSLASLDCSVHEAIPAGDHTIVVTRVLDAVVLDESARPLTVSGGDSGTIEESATGLVDGDV